MKDYIKNHSALVILAAAITLLPSYFVYNFKRGLFSSHDIPLDLISISVVDTFAMTVSLLAASTFGVICLFATIVFLLNEEMDKYIAIVLLVVLGALLVLNLNGWFIYFESPAAQNYFAIGNAIILILVSVAFVFTWTDQRKVFFWAFLLIMFYGLSIGAGRLHNYEMFYRSPKILVTDLRDGKRYKYILSQEGSVFAECYVNEKRFIRIIDVNHVLMEARSESKKLEC